jgi:hypothetical protein
MLACSTHHDDPRSRRSSRMTSTTSRSRAGRGASDTRRWLVCVDSRAHGRAQQRQLDDQPSSLSVTGTAVERCATARIQLTISAPVGTVVPAPRPAGLIPPKSRREARPIPVRSSNGSRTAARCGTPPRDAHARPTPAPDPPPKRRVTRFGTGVACGSRTGQQVARRQTTP